MSDDDDESTFDEVARRELEQMAATIAKRGWETRLSELDSLCARRGIEAVYELGRIVGHRQLARSIDLAAADGWDPQPGLQTRGPS